MSAFNDKAARDARWMMVDETSRRPAREESSSDLHPASAVCYLLESGVASEVVASRLPGFDFAVTIPGCVQHMTTAQLVEFAENEREMRA